ncbi:CoA activase [candidate division WOR-3 bacterium]|uniref:CoA activase n=1 Tax=candidate division WOR-3 bacterium TaxID=2052148 RepID=A0A660SLT5_UNCW3|nr:MAG: CoA activase [candidate division WOR-3 bacterium]
MRLLGVDIGSVAIKFAYFEDGELAEVGYQPHRGGPTSILKNWLVRFQPDFLALTGSGGNQKMGYYINEIIATGYGVSRLYPGMRSIIEIGGEDSKLIILNDKGDITDFAINTICAAGSGIFLEQQAHRLDLRVEELGQIALTAENPARIAGRCSVFAKSDMIHLQQIGIPKEEIVAGLCFALARNFKSLIVQGRKIIPPVAFVGGVAANQGMVRALSDTFGIEELIVPDYHAVIGAIGVGRYALDHGLLRPPGEIEPKVSIISLPPLNGRGPRPRLRIRKKKLGKYRYLGIDVGSVSTNLALIDEYNNLIDRIYLPTAGNPIQAVRIGLKKMRERLGTIPIDGVGVTGSGRYLIGSFVGADLIKNEITAHARGALAFDPAVDTIFEIGGQDSKFIALDKGKVIDFAMNKICAAGTGSFLEEQAEILGVRIEEFGKYALQSKSPPDLGDRCTVFMASEVIHHQALGVKRNDLLAGLAYSIARNYLNRVVVDKRIGERIFLQGGVALNPSVVAAFEAVLKKEVRVPPNCDVIGAIGVAILVREAGVRRSKFRGFEVIDLPYQSRTFECSGCTNHCQISEVAMEGERFYYGGRCERYEKRRREISLPNLFKEREERIQALISKAGFKTIGIPNALGMIELLPFWIPFFQELGFKIELSGRTNRSLINRGLELAGADTCFPLKVAFGHIHQLATTNPDFIFIPSIITFPKGHPDFERSFFCPYSQTLPYTARINLKGIIPEEKIIAPEIYLERGEEGVIAGFKPYLKQLGIKVSRLRRAFRKAWQTYKGFKDWMVARGSEVLSNYDGPVMVIVSRPYNGYDLEVNLNLPQKFLELGVLPIPIDFLPLPVDHLGDDWRNMYWYYGQKLLAAAQVITQNENYYGVYLSNFACGPDSFLIRYFQELMGEKVHLILELDEHSGDAGMTTRCEAFLDSIKGSSRRGRWRRLGEPKPIKRGPIIYIPRMCDHALILAAALQNCGVEARVMEESDEESLELARPYTSGKECLPAQVTIGDMIKTTRRKDFDPKRAAFFMASGTGPCRFGQYYKLHRIVLDHLGYREIPIYSPNQGRSLYDDLKGLGRKFIKICWEGLIGVDILTALRMRIVPYEKKKGSADRIYQEYLTKIIQRVKRGGGIHDLIQAAGAAFDHIERIDREVPRVGVVGEIFVRSHPFSNQRLISRLEAEGVEVRLPPIGEWFFYLNFTRKRTCRSNREYRRFFETLLLDKAMGLIAHRLYRLAGLPPEPTTETILRLAEPYLHDTFEGEAILSVGKAIDFLEEGCDGIINVMPFTCMPGNIVSILLKGVKEKYQRPILSIAYDGLHHPTDRIRFQAFVSKIKEKRS